MKSGNYLLLLIVVFSLKLHGQSRYIGSIDLTNVVEDKLFVEIQTPKIGKRKVEFHIPKIVPGTYSISGFGRFLTKFRAYDKNGKVLRTEKLSHNRYLIKSANKLHKISYWIEDTYDTNKPGKIFEPAGTNIDEGKNFVLNTYGFFGYLDGYKDLEYELNIAHPEELYGGTSMIDLNDDPTEDQFITANYFDLADAPIMYASPDTTVMNIGGAEVLVHVHSPKNLISSKFVMENVSEILLAQKNYLGGELPVDRYCFLIYLFEGSSQTGLLGALEHSYSSMYSFPEVNPSAIVRSIRDIAAHEFFHIITPLNIHSEEIGNFDFIDPKMSQHLWLYEGVTEYAAGHMQANQDLIDFGSYIEILEDKIKQSKNYNDTVAFTTMSKECLGRYRGEYGNVYQKGALIGAALDIKLRELSNGNYGLRDLMDDLSEDYGKDVSFKDDLLFDKIVSLTYPEIGDFLEKHVAGPNPIPYKEVFDKVGVNYVEGGTFQQVSMGNISLSMNSETNRVVITDVSEVNSFGEEMGYLPGDEFLYFNEEKVTPIGLSEVVESYRDNKKAGDLITAVVMRSVDGKDTEVELTANAITVPVDRRTSLRVDLSASSEKVALRKAWIKN